MNLQLGVVSLITLLSFWPGVLGGEIPQVNGVYGGLSRTVRRREVPESANAVRAPGKLRGVVENSGICGSLYLLVAWFSVFNAYLETTPGVYQASGYGDLTKKESIW
jgi:hypothetical protein